MCPLYRESGSFLKNDSHCLFLLLHFPSSTAKQSAEECKMAKKREAHNWFKRRQINLLQQKTSNISQFTLLIYSLGCQWVRRIYFSAVQTCLKNEKSRDVRKRSGHTKSDCWLIARDAFLAVKTNPIQLTSYFNLIRARAYWRNLIVMRKALKSSERCAREKFE